MQKNDVLHSVVAEIVSLLYKHGIIINADAEFGAQYINTKDNVEPTQYHASALPNLNPSTDPAPTCQNRISDHRMRPFIAILSKIRTQA